MVTEQAPRRVPAPLPETTACPAPSEGDPPDALRRGVPAALRITGWLMLLMAVVLLSVVVVTRGLLLRQVDQAVNSAVAQEAREFSGVAATGVDRATRRPFRNVHELLYNHLQRQHPDEDEVIVGAVRGPGGMTVLRQDRRGPYPLHERPAVLDAIVAAARSSGTVTTEAGEMRWAKVTVTNPGQEDTEGSFVVGYLTESDRAEVDRTIRTLTLVSLLGLVLAAAASWLVAQRILQPVRLVHRAAERITEQDLTQRIPVEGNDEFAALAEQFNAMLNRLEQAFGTQRQFVDDAGHELRTPITIIRGHLELIDTDPAERAAVVRLCIDELDRMSRIVDDLLLLAKSERPDFVQPQPVELAELTSDIDAKVRALANRRWRLEAIGDGIAHLDPQRITQAVVQLAQNAVQFTTDGDEIMVGSAADRETVSFWITDHGPGVPYDEQHTIFQRFARGSARHGPGHRGGAGLGLAIVHAIADGHHGSVKLLSTPGAGATFGLEIPLGAVATA